MKHLLNNLSEEEKNSIREQHEGGMRLETSRFKTLLENKSGNVKPLVENEEEEDFGFESPFCKSCEGTGCEECDGSGMKRNSVVNNDEEGEYSEDEGYEGEPNEEIFNLIDDECVNLENDDECVVFLNTVIEYCEDKLYEMGQYGGSDEEEDLGDLGGNDSEFEDELDLREFDELEEDNETW